LRDKYEERTLAACETELCRLLDRFIARAGARTKPAGPLNVVVPGGVVFVDIPYLTCASHVELEPDGTPNPRPSEELLIKNPMAQWCPHEWYIEDRLEPALQAAYEDRICALFRFA